MYGETVKSSFSFPDLSDVQYKYKKSAFTDVNITKLGV